MVNFDKFAVVSQSGGEVSFSLEKTEKDGVLSAEITFKEDCAVKEIVLFKGGHGFSPDTSLYGDGYQKLSQYGGTIKNPGACLKGGYLDKSHYKMPQTEGFFTVYNFALFEGEGEITLIGASSCNRFRTEIRFNEKELAVVQALENLTFKAGDKIALEETVILKGKDKNALFEKFGGMIGKNHPKKEVKDFPVGWCSWYCIGPQISERKIFKSLKEIKKSLPEVKYVQIDDGFQPYMGDWLEVSKKFKRSMKEICLDIKKEGFEPAIWLAPFIASPKSRLLREHPEYFVTDKSGEPLCSKDVTFPGWRDGPWYMLDGTNPAARAYIKKVVKTIYNEWGVKYFKLDANTWGALPFGERYDKNATSVEAYRLMMEAVWEAAGDDAFILGCNAPMWPSLGLVSGMRVTNDTFRNIEAMEQIAGECFRRNWMNDVLWLNDPDCLLMENAKVSIVNPAGKRRKALKQRDMYKFNAVYIRASGGSILSGDFIKRYTPEDIEVFRKLISFPKIAARFDSSYEVGVIEYENKKEYCIFNMSNGEKEYTLPVPEGFKVTDMYSDEILSDKSGNFAFKLPQNTAEWIMVSEK